ncbi:MAG: hypothetical protein BWY09_01552 [Candidatus Hydrogenedentes bacterium ADurb.Bin179]|nr:MAG: hypothetical protein BWY09_01552 [Candidatus Hydrogenedentes bacterium ADurb.Bin179]
MLLVHHDHAEVGKGREYGRAGANHDAYLPLPRQAPGVIALPVAQAAVQDGDILFEPCIEAAHCLRGQGNFGNQHDGGTVQGQYFFDSLQVDFRFTRTRNTVDEKGFISVVIQRPADSVQGALLFRIQAELVFRKGVRLHFGPPVRFRLETCDQPLLFKGVKHRFVGTMLLIEAGCRLFLFAVKQIQIYGGAARRLALQRLQRIIARNGRLHQAYPGFHQRRSAFFAEQNLFPYKPPLDQRAQAVAQSLTPGAGGNLSGSGGAAPVQGRHDGALPLGKPSFGDLLRG